MEPEILYRYDAAANTGSDGAPLAYLPGVPLRDLTATDVGAMPAHIRAAIVGSPFFTYVGPAADEPPAEEAA